MRLSRPAFLGQLPNTSLHSCLPAQSCSWLKLVQAWRDVLRQQQVAHSCQHGDHQNTVLWSLSRLCCCLGPPTVLLALWGEGSAPWVRMQQMPHSLFEDHSNSFGVITGQQTTMMS